jgi:hypothetical protein
VLLPKGKTYTLCEQGYSVAWYDYFTIPKRGKQLLFSWSVGVSVNGDGSV